LAISGDSLETMKEYKASLKAEFPFIPDTDAKLMKLYDVKYPFFDAPSRHTFVVGAGLKVLSVFSGGEAIDADKAIESCLGPPPKKK
jgi:peroxiredoxin Q/BCP